MRPWADDENVNSMPVTSGPTGSSSDHSVCARRHVEFALEMKQYPCHTCPSHAKPKAYS